jgi:hypothetical protein
MQGDKCMMMHKKIKEQTNLKRGFFWAVTIDTTNKGSRPEIHAHVGEKSWLDYRIFIVLNLSTPPTKGSFSTPPTKDSCSN